MDDKQRIREAADILEIVGAYTVLKRKSGGWHEGLCPFHTEKSASFRVQGDEGYFRCFGCGAKGNVIDFVMQKEGMVFRDALCSLADKYRVTLSQTSPEQADERRRMREAIDASQEFYRQTFLTRADGAEARAYALKRELSAEILERFGIGAAPKAWDGLFKHLTDLGFAAALLDAAGLVRTNQQGGYRDMFRNRLIFPICTDMGAVVAFGGRALADEDQPKYLNSPESQLYQKGAHLYGMHLAKDAVRKADRAVLVEGYMDALALHQAGFQEAVGVLGTALTPQQAKSLLRFTESRRVVVAFDADRAGQEAAARGISVLEDVCQNAGIDMAILCVPEGKDPDAYLKANGAEGFRALLETAPGVVDFQIDMELTRQKNLDSPEGKAQAVKAIAPIFKRLDSQIRAEPYIRKVAMRLGINELTLTLELKRQTRHNGALPRGTTVAAVAQQRGAEAERGLIYLMVEHPLVRSLVAERLGDIALPTPDCQILRERLMGDLAEVTVWADVIDATEGSPGHEILMDLRFTDLANLEGEPRWAAENFIDSLLSEHFGRAADKLRQELSLSDLSSQQRERVSMDYTNAVTRAKEHRVRLSGRAEPAAAGS